MGIKMLNRIFNRTNIKELDKNAEKRHEILTEFKRLPFGPTALDWARDNHVRFDVVGVYKQNSKADKELEKRRVIGGYDHDKRLVTCDVNLPKIAALSCFSHELRHAWQYAQGYSRAHERSNPCGLPILTRFKEADAFSFDVLAVVEYLRLLSKPEQQEQLKLLRPDSLQRHQIALSNSEDTEDGDARLRQKMFDYFFEEQDHARKKRYDAKELDRGYLYATAAADLSLSLISLGLFSKQAVFDVTEDMLTLVGQSAWGECQGQNYLEGDGRSFEITEKYTGDFTAAEQRALKILSVIPLYVGLNKIHMRDGTTRPLVNLKPKIK
jgi:hypothetical protein